MDPKIRCALMPTVEEIQSLRLSSNRQIAGELLGAKGERALDIGCGDGKFTRSLAALFKNVDGVDVKAGKIDEAAAAAKAAGLNVRFQVASGEDLPYADAAFEAVAFSNSLHHMPHPEIALGEAVRVLKPGHLLYVMEPVPSGNYHEATKLVNDETEVRTQAYEALTRLIDSGMLMVEELMYRAKRDFADFEEWRADQIGRDQKRKTRFDTQPEEVKRRFESNADRTDGGFSFTQVSRINLLKKNATH